MKRVLVTFASKHGSTREIAEAIAETLREGGLDAECMRAHDVHSLSGYHAVVLGSAVYMKRWRREARHFLRRHASELPDRAFWVFSSGPVGDPANETEGSDEWMEPKHTVETAIKLGARDHAVFGGSIDPEVKGIPASAMARGIPSEFLDRRDWDEIRGWAADIATQLVGAGSRASTN